MALAAQNVMKARGRDKILVGGVDAMPPAIEAVIDGRMHATVRNPSCRIHGGAVVAGVAAVVAGEKTGDGGIPKHVITDGPVVTKPNAEGMLVDAEALPDLIRLRERGTTASERRPILELAGIGKTLRRRDGAGRRRLHAARAARCTGWSARTVPASRR